LDDLLIESVDIFLHGLKFLQEFFLIFHKLFVLDLKFFKTQFQNLIMFKKLTVLNLQPAVLILILIHNLLYMAYLLYIKSQLIPICGFLLL